MNDEQFIKKLKSLGATREEVERSFSGIDKGFSRQEVVGQFKKYKAPKLQQEAWRMEEQRPQRTVAAQQESFNRLPAMDRALAGAGKTLYSTTAAPVKRLMGQGDEARETIKAYDTASQGDFMAGLGEYGTDIGLSLMPGAGAARALKLGGKSLKGAMSLGAMEGIGSAGVHQLQRFGETGDISPMEAAIETGASTVLPGLGNLVGKGLKKMAPGMLRSAVKPARKLMESTNPPNFVKPLEDKLITKFGGLEEGIDNTRKVVKKLAEKRDNLIKNEDITVNITDATRKVGKKLNDMVKNAEIDFEDAKGAAGYTKSALKTAVKQKSGSQPIKTTVKPIKGNIAIETRDIDVLIQKSKEKPGFWEYKKTYADPRKLGEKPYDQRPWFFESKEKAIRKAQSEGFEIPTREVKKIGKLSVSGEDAVKIRKLADKNSKFNPFKGPTQNPDKVVFNEAYRRVIEDEIEKNIAKKSGKLVSSQYKALKKEMADLIPFQKAGEFRLAQQGNNYQFSLMDMGSMGVGSSLGGLPAAAGGLGLRRLTQTPGGARMLYGMGEGLTRPQTRLGGLGMQTLRSSAFGPTGIGGQ